MKRITYVVFGVLMATMVAVVAQYFAEDQPGIVPGPTATDISNNDFLRADGTWSAPPGAAGGDSVSIDGVGVTDPDFVSTGDIDFVDTSNTVTANINANSVGTDEIDLTIAPVWTGDHDFGGGGIEIENNTALPGSCTVGQIFLDTDATSGEQLYACEGGTFVLQGGGGNDDAVSINSVGVVDPDFVSTGQVSFTDTSNTVTADINDDSIVAADFADADWGDVSVSTNVVTLDANVVDSAEIATDAVGTDEIDLTISPVWTGDHDFGGGGLEVPNSITLPATCTVGQSYMDTDATSGQRFYLCESTNTWALQGGAGGDSVSIDGVGVVDPDFVSTGDIDFVDTSNTITANINADVITFDDIADALTPEAGTSIVGADTIAGNPTLPANAIGFGTTGLIFEGATGGGADANELLLVPTDPTADRTLTLPDATDTLVGRATTDTLTNKTINTASNTITVVEADISDLAHTATAITDDIIVAADFADGDWGDVSVATNVVTLDANVVDSAEIATDAVGTDEIDQTISPVWTGDHDFGGGGVEIPNSTTLPATCTVGEIYMDTDATSGQRIYACESVNTWALQGDGGAGSADSISIDGVGVVDPDFVSTGDIDFVDTSNTVTANINASSIVAGDFADGDWGDVSVATNVVTLDAGVVDSTAIADGSVAAADQENIGEDTIIGRTASGTGVRSALTASEVAEIINSPPSHVAEFFVDGSLAGDDATNRIYNDIASALSAAGAVTNVGDDYRAVVRVAPYDNGGLGYQPSVSTTITIPNGVILTGWMGGITAHDVNDFTGETMITMATPTADPMIDLAGDSGIVGITLLASSVPANWTAIQGTGTGISFVRNVQVRIASSAGADFEAVRRTSTGSMVVEGSQLFLPSSGSGGRCAVNAATGFLTVRTTFCFDNGNANHELFRNESTGSLSIEFIKPGQASGITAATLINNTTTGTVYVNNVPQMGDGVVTNPTGTVTHLNLFAQDQNGEVPGPTATDITEDGFLDAGGDWREVLAGDMADSDHGDFTYSSNVATLDANVVDSAEIATDAVGTDEIDLTISPAWTGDHDFGGGGIEIENNTVLPGSCTVGQLFLDTDATSGQQLYGCEGGTFVLQGDGGGAPGTDSIGTDELDDGADTPLAGEWVQVDPADTTQFNYRTDAELLSDTGAITASSTDTLTNKTIDANGAGNSITNIENADLVDDTIDFTKIADALTPEAGTSIVGADTIAGNPTLPANAVGFGTTGIIFEGATGGGADANEMLLVPTDPTADRTLTLPDATDTLVGRATTDTLTNKTINTASNTITVVEADISDLAHTATAITDDIIVAADFANADWGDVSVTANVVSIDADAVTEADLKAVDTAVDEECLTYESTTGDFEWQTCGSVDEVSFHVNKGGTDGTGEAVNNTVSPVAFGTEVFDNGGNFASNAFTAPTDGRYTLGCTVRVNSLADQNGIVSYIYVDAGGGYAEAIRGNRGSISGSVPGAVTVTGLLSLSSGDKAKCYVWQDSGSDKDVEGDTTNTYFWGYLSTSGGGALLPTTDTNSLVEGSADDTKEMRIEVDGLTTGTVRVLTMPDADVDLGALTASNLATNSVDSDEIAANAVGTSELDLTIAPAWTGDHDFGGGGIEIENNTVLPGSCTVGQIFLDTDATSGQQLYGCEGGTFVLQGDGGAVGADSVGTSELDDGVDTPLAGEWVQVDPADTTQFNYRTDAELLSDTGAITASSTDTLTNKTFNANGTGNSLTNVDAADLTNDTITFDQIADALTPEAGTSIVGADTLAGNPTLPNNGIGFGTTGIIFEGATGGAGNAFETLLTVTDPTADRTWTIPNGSDTAVGLSLTQTLTNKTIAFASNTLTNVMSLTTAQSITAGIKKTFQANATNAGLRLLGVTASPSAAVAGDIWYRTDTENLVYRGTSLVRNLVAEALAQTLTNKTIDGDNNTISNLAHGAEVDNPTSGVHGVTGSVVGTSDSQTLTNKTITQPVLTLTQSATPTPTAEGVVEWDTDNDQLKIGDGAGTVTIGGGGGDVSKVGTPADNQIGVWTGDGTIEGTTDFTFDGADLLVYNAVNDGNPEIRLGASDAEEFHIQSVFDAVAQTLNYVLFQTDAASATADKGLFRFNVDGTNILDVDDGGLELTGSITVSGTVDGRDVATDGTKLDGIEAAADVTDATNVNAAGAIMHSDIGGNGMVARTAAETYTNRTITGTTNEIEITNGDGVSGNPTIGLPNDVTIGNDLTVTGDVLADRDFAVTVTNPAGDAATTGDGKMYFPIPARFNLWELTGVVGLVTTQSTSGAVDVDLARDRGGTITDMLSTNLTIDANERSSTTAATAAVINTSFDDLATDDFIRVDIDGAGTGTKGLMLIFTFSPP